MDEKDLKVNIPTEKEADIEQETKQENIEKENKTNLTETKEENTTVENKDSLENTNEKLEQEDTSVDKTPRERTPRERRPRVTTEENTENSEVVENAETTEETKSERPVRERRERPAREPRERTPRERTEREPRERTPRERTEREPRERTPRERTEREPRERTPRERTEREPRERTPRERTEREPRERSGRAARGRRNEEPQIKLIVGPSPHLRTTQTVSTLMRDVVIALIPTLLAGIYFFGLRALIVTLVSVAFAVLSEYVYEKLAKKPITIGDFSAVVTGMLLAYNVPVTIPYWMIAIASIFAIIVVKQLYGGIGMNFMNPALAARAALMASFPTAMANYVAPNTAISSFLHSGTYSNLVDAATYATPLSKGTEVNFLEAFIGIRGGCIGEVSTLCLLIGAGYLLYRKVISLRIPVIFIISTAVVLTLTGTPISKLPVQLFMGGLILGAFFMATDYVSAPVNRKAQIFFAIGCGVVTALIRNLGALPEGVSYSILFMNIFTPLLEKYCIPKVFGEGRDKK